MMLQSPFSTKNIPFGVFPARGAVCWVFWPDIAVLSRISTDANTPVLPEAFGIHRPWPVPYPCRRRRPGCAQTRPDYPVWNNPGGRRRTGYPISSQNIPIGMPSAGTGRPRHIEGPPYKGRDLEVSPNSRRWHGYASMRVSDNLYPLKEVGILTFSLPDYPSFTGNSTGEPRCIDR